ncbi:hypothetical protein Apa02nite_088610 [Actinoplanes palleronii]|uniref:Uncharacterized protein n=2 Tax=Actinoplanes palleronii TaxID=113570 RepID=A0ABQ4BQ06_9ACTN|nr:hypothetical protein Apa02nite_088610 [Actinoplanes palleronii]
MAAMTGIKSEVRPAGLRTGSVVALTFGTVFVVANSGGLAAPWPLVIRVAGVLVAVVLAVLLYLRTRAATAVTSSGGAGFADRRYWYVVAAEVVALFGGLSVINRVFEAPAVAVAWVAVVVGVHFFALAWAWRMPLYHWLGGAMTVLGLAGFLVYAAGASAATVGLIAGVGSGVALFATVAVALRTA